MSFYGKINKTHNPRSLDLRNHYLGVTPQDISKLEKWTMVIIDPGTENFAIRAEERSALTGIKTLWFDLVKIDSKDKANPDVYWNLNEYLIRMTKTVPNINIVVIEWQMAINYRTVRVSQHCVTFFDFYFRQRSTSKRSLCRLVEIDPQMKTQVLGGPTGQKSSVTKKWSKYVASQLLCKRGDIKGLQTLEKNFSKRDDLSDTVALAEAYCILNRLYSDFDSLEKDKVVKLLTVNPTEVEKNVERMGVSRKDFQTFLKVVETLNLQEPSPQRAIVETDLIFED